MASLRPALCVVALAASVASGQAPATAKKADLTVKARRILVEHCSACHGEKPSPSTLGVLDHGQLLRSDGIVPFIRPGDPKASQALALIEEGSMPPGRLAKV